jgi:hypothetical protein
MGGEADHGGANAVDDVDYGTRIGVKEGLVLGRDRDLARDCGGCFAAADGGR